MLLFYFMPNVIVSWDPLSYVHLYHSSEIERFMLDEITQRNTAKKNSYTIWNSKIDPMFFFHFSSTDGKGSFYWLGHFIKHKPLYFWRVTYFICSTFFNMCVVHLLKTFNSLVSLLENEILKVLWTYNRFYKSTT